MRRALVALIPALVLLASTASGQAQAPEPLAKLAADWESAFNAGDAEAVAAMYTEDAIRIPPGEDLIRGRDEISQGVLDLAGWTIEIRAFGGLLDKDVGATWGMYQLSGTEEGETIVQRGRWMNAVRRTSEGWKIHRDIWHLAPESQ